MQTKTHIQQLLHSAGIAPNKRLGQHFLIDKNLMNLLVRSADITDDDVILEVGTGTGSLTEALAAGAGRVVTVEADRALADLAAQQLAGRDNVESIHADILASKSTIAPQVLEALGRARKKHRGRLLLVANLPYNVASPLVADLVRGPSPPAVICVTVQKEVAGRMTAGAGGGDYGSLSVYLGATGRAAILRILPPSVFWPAPQVDSAMVRYVRDPDMAGRIGDMAVLADLVGLFFGHRRKTLGGCARLAGERLARIDWDAVFAACGLDPGNRPSQLAPADFVDLANACRLQRDGLNRAG